MPHCSTSSPTHDGPGSAGNRQLLQLDATGGSKERPVGHPAERLGDQVPGDGNVEADGAHGWLEVGRMRMGV